VNNLAQKKQPEGGEHAGERGEKVREGVNNRKKIRVAVWHGKQEMHIVRARGS
jgi:hypothetical protein